MGLFSTWLGLERCVPRQANILGPANDLNFLLKKSSEYCELLRRATISYTCREKIVEESFLPIPESVKEYVQGKIEPGEKGKKPRVIRKSSEYEYRVRILSGVIEERRTPLEDQKEGHNETAAHLRTEALFLEPAGFFSREKQPHFHFELKKTERLMGENAYVVTAHLKDEKRGHNLSAKIWLSQRNFGVLRIEKLQDTLGRYDDLIKDPELKRAAVHQKTIVEFNCEYQELRFPTFFNAEEYYYQIIERSFFLGFSTKRQLRLRFSATYEKIDFDISSPLDKL